MSKISKEKEAAITQEQLKEVAEYSELTGVFKWRLKFTRNIVVGAIMGSFKKASGEIIITIKNEEYSAHRLAWLYVYGYFPSRRIEHINGDKKDNRIVNLRQQCLVGENGKLPQISVSHNFISKTEKALLSNKDVDITINWDKLSLQARSRAVEVKCNKCGSVENRLTSNLTTGKYKCVGCTRVKYTKEADFVGVDYLNHVGNDIYVVCRVCNSTIKSSNVVLRKQMSPRCIVCIENKCNVSANARGFNYLGIRDVPEKKHTVVAVKCRSDGAEVLLPIGQLIAGYINCVECRLNRYRVALAKKGCSLVNIEAGVRCRTTYRTSNGDVFTAAGGKVLKVEFKVDELGHWHNHHSVYLIVNSFNNSLYCKIGTANVPVKRLRQLKLLGESKVFTLESFSDRFGADKLESDLHQEFKQFELDSEIAKTYSGRHLRRKRVGSEERTVVKDGIHEWFTHEVYDILKTRYNLKEEDNGINSNPTNQVNYSG